MDFPLNLSKNFKFVNNFDEFKQNVLIILTNKLGSFVQSPLLGSYGYLHTDSTDFIEENIRASLEQIKGLYINSIIINNYKVYLNLTYSGSNINLEYNLDE